MRKIFIRNLEKQVVWFISFLFLLYVCSKLGVHIPFNSKDHIGTGQQYLSLRWNSNPHTGESLYLDVKFATHLTKLEILNENTNTNEMMQLYY